MRELWAKIVAYKDWLFCPQRIKNSGATKGGTITLIEGLRETAYCFSL